MAEWVRKGKWTEGSLNFLIIYGISKSFRILHAQKRSFSPEYEHVRSASGLESSSWLMCTWFSLYPLFSLIFSANDYLMKHQHTMLIEVVFQVWGVARQAVHGVGVCPLGQAGLGLRGFLQGQTSNLHAIYIHVWIQSSCSHRQGVNIWKWKCLLVIAVFSCCLNILFNFLLLIIIAFKIMAKAQHWWWAALQRG